MFSKLLSIFTKKTSKPVAPIRELKPLPVIPTNLEGTWKHKASGTTIAVALRTKDVVQVQKESKVTGFMLRHYLVEHYEKL